MDQIDREIIQILRQEGRASYTDVGEEVGVSEGTVRNRVERMLENGVIERFTVETTRSNSAIVMVEVESGASIQDMIDNMPEKLQVHEVAGNQDLVVEVSSNGMKQLNNVLDKIRRIEGVQDTTTYTVLDSHRT